MKAGREEVRRIALATIAWCRILHENGDGWPSDADVDHSALLNRLLDGKAPLPEPPPLSFSYPWYELVDTGAADAFRVFEPAVAMAEALGPDHLVINQSREWIIRDRGEGWWLVQWKGVGSLYRVEPTTLYGTSFVRGAPERVPYPGWRLTRSE
jgi:hypothetical protein